LPVLAGSFPLADPGTEAAVYFIGREALSLEPGYGIVRNTALREIT
jgi:hypothetical protein